MRRVALVVNPISGRGRAPRAAERAVQMLRSAGLETEIFPTERIEDPPGRIRGNGPELAAAAARAGCDAVLAVGGDGTLGEVVRGLRGTPVPAGIIPVGTANVVSRELRIPRRPERAARAFLSGSPRVLDAGEVDGRMFLAMVGVGIDGEIVRRIAAARRGPISMGTYVKPALSAFRGFRAEALKLFVDGREAEGPAFGVIVTNTRNYGGLFSVTPEADPADGWFDFLQQRRAGFRALLRCGLAAALRRRAGAAVAAYGRGREFRIDAPSPVSVQVDGDFHGTTPVNIRLLRAAVRIVCPATTDPSPSRPDSPTLRSQA